MPCKSYLYIPIWLYSNFLWYFFICLANSFTFQSGSIQIMAHKRRLPRNFDFTFQSGSIQIKRNLLRLQHSILYIPIWFYSNKISCQHCPQSWLLYIPIWFYSNTTKGRRLQSMYVLYIPIWFYSNPIKPDMMGSCYLLYIPIWFYSNYLEPCCRFSRSVFTFQSGSIQMLRLYHWDSTNHLLYIPIWFYSNKGLKTKNIANLIFTFQSGSIQIVFKEGTEKNRVALHSNLVLFKWWWWF